MWGGVEVLGVLLVGRGAGIQGNGLFLIIQTPHPHPHPLLHIYTHRQKRPPHGPMTTLSWAIYTHTKKTHTVSRKQDDGGGEGGGCVVEHF